MNRVVVKKKGFAGRCEICHQTDLFDAVAELCERCKFLTEKPYAVWGLLVSTRKLVSGLLLLTYLGNCLILFDKTILVDLYFCFIGILPFVCCGLLVVLVYSSKEVKF
jgi:hypothetical protein